MNDEAAEDPRAPWNFFAEKDKKKLGKAGYATPRGGAKNAYQNHVYRNNKVIIPFERIIEGVDLSVYQDGYVVRLYPDQYFESPNKPRGEFLTGNTNGIAVRVGENAFVLYRSYSAYDNLPPLAGWEVRHLIKKGTKVIRRGLNGADVGQYILRIPRLGDRPARTEGPPQGIFAPEYADAETNFLSQCVLAWLIIRTVGSPYTNAQAEELKTILAENDLLDDAIREKQGVISGGITACPLCGKKIKYSQLHAMLDLSGAAGLGNAGAQVQGATRSTIVNLFHLDPLRYGALLHEPKTVAWGHAVCNTVLGQRKCHPLAALQEDGMKLGIIAEDGIETFGWMSKDFEMIRSSAGDVWIRLVASVVEGTDEPA